MNEPIKVAVLGGSSVASPLLIRALADIASRPPISITLIGRTVEKLERVSLVSRNIAASASAPLTVNQTIEPEAGLEGADYILNQIRVGGYRARMIDESFPRQFGIPGEETFGPGGMNNALRTIPVVLDYCRIIEKVAPNALLVNLTNPSSFIQYAVDRFSKVGVVGVCDSPVWLARAAASMLGVPLREMRIGYVGMHHFGWITEATWLGRDVMPQLLSKIDELPGLPVDADLVRAMGAIPTSYYKYYYHADRMLAGQQGKGTRAEQLLELEAKILADYGDETAEGVPPSLEQRGAHWYDEIVVPVIIDHVQDARSIYTLNVTNGSVVPWMPPEAIVELPVVVARDGFHPLCAPSAPPDIQAMVRLNAAFEMLWVEAIVEHDRDKALRAMMLNHLVGNLDQARAILEEIWTD